MESLSSRHSWRCTQFTNSPPHTSRNNRMQPSFRGDFQMLLDDPTSLQYRHVYKHPRTFMPNTSHFTQVIVISLLSSVSSSSSSSYLKIPSRHVLRHNTLLWMIICILHSFPTKMSSYLLKKILKWHLPSPLPKETCNKFIQPCGYKPNTVRITKNISFIK